MEPPVGLLFLEDLTFRFGTSSLRSRFWSAPRGELLGPTLEPPPTLAVVLPLHLWNRLEWLAPWLRRCERLTLFVDTNELGDDIELREIWAMEVEALRSPSGDRLPFASGWTNARTGVVIDCVRANPLPVLRTWYRGTCIGTAARVPGAYLSICDIENGTSVAFRRLVATS